MVRKIRARSSRVSHYLLVPLLIFAHFPHAYGLPTLLERQRNLGVAKNLTVALEDTTFRLLREGNQLELAAGKVITRTAAWVAAWDKLRASINDTNLADTSRLATDIQARLQATSDETAALAAESKAIAAAISVNLTNLAKVPLPATDHPQRAATLISLNNMVALIRDNLNTVRTKAEFIATQVSAVQTAMGAYVDAKARVVIARAGLADAERIIGEVVAFLEAEKVIDPLLVRVRTSYSKFSASYVALSIYHAMDATKELNQTADEAIRTLQGARIADEYKNEAIAKAKDYRDRAERQLAELLARFSKPEIVKQFAKRRAQLLRPRCARTDPAVDCSLLRIIADIPDEKIMAMNEAWLRFFEFAWDRVESPVLNQSKEG